MKKIKFSCLMSVYYKENKDYLKEAIDSIVNQTLKPNEFVIIEDGTLTDELENTIKEYESKYDWIRVIRYKENRGLGIALRDGVLECKYPYIARMDSDDISLPDRFEKQISYLEEHKEIDVLGGYITEFDNQTNSDLSQRIVPLMQDDIKAYLKKRNPMNHVTVIYKKDKVIEAGNYMECPYFEDYYLWARMLEKDYTFENIDETLVRVRAGLEMSSRRGSIKYIKSIVNFEQKLKGLKLINTIDYITNTLIRSVVSIIPNKIRYKLYQKKLREA